MFNPQLPLEEAYTLPAIYYTCPLDERHVFHKSWHYAGRTDQVRAVGDNFATTIAEEPVLVVKNETGIEAFANVCRHRGTVLHEKGSCNKFVCPYHGWTYSLKGELLGCTEPEGMVNFNKQENGLTKFKVQVHEPFIFVNVDGKKEPLIGLPETGLSYHGKKTYDVRCNWKVFVDNYLDGGYHINYAHKKLAEAVDYSSYKTTINGDIVAQEAPLSGSDIRKGSAQYIWVFPNLMVNISEGAMDTNLVVPVDNENCKVIFDFYFDGSISSSDSIELSDRIQREDIEICERVQRGLHSSSYHAGRFNVKREAAVYHFHKLYHSKMFYP